MTEAIEGELVFPGDRRYGPRQAVAARANVARSDVVTVARVTKRVATHDRTRAVCREIAYIPGGVAAAARWFRENCTNAGYARDIAAAQAAGNLEHVIALRKMADEAKHHRFERIKFYLSAPQELLKALVVVAVVAVGGLLLLGVAAALAFGDPTLVTGPIRAVMWAVATAVWLCTVGGSLLVGGLCGLVVLCLWAAGRRAGNVPEFLAPADQKTNQPGDTITRALAVQAFRDLGITALRQAIDKMDDGGNSLITSHGIIRSGCGVEFDFALPSGVDVEEVIKSSRLAGNLLRHKHEVFPTIAQAARTVNVWAANSKALDEPIGASPLVYDESIRADYKHGTAPWGEDLRGEPFGLNLYQNHLLVTGLSKMGKTFSLRALALWLVTDTKPRIKLADLKGFGDWRMFTDLAETFIEGCAKDHIIAATEMLEDAVEEMKHRLQNRIVDPPLIVLVDEAQLAFASDVTDAAGVPYGGAKNRSRFYQACLEILNQGRAVNVMLWLGTQDPTNQNLPERVREAMHIRCSLALGNAKKTRMALGEKAADTGAAPHNLRYGIDRGTVVVSGDGVDFEQGQAFATVRTHFIDDEQACAIAARALKLRGPVAPRDPNEVRDLLQDVHEAFGEDDRVRAAHMADRLRETGYRAYRTINGTTLVGQLAQVGVIVDPGQGRHFPVRADRVLRALDERQGVR